MTTADPIQLLFGGMEKLGPGSDDDTLQVLRGLHRSRFNLVLDAGCGAGRQTIALAGELRTTVHAVDSHRPFLDALVRRAAQSGVTDLIEVHCMDMGAIPDAFSEIDLFWSEGAAYNIGFANALITWAPAIRSGGFLVVSELAWLTEAAPAAARDFFQTCYPSMRHARENISLAESAGYQVLGTHTLPRRAWIDGYYEVLEPRARSLADHADATVRSFALETLKEIEVFRASADSYGYVFNVLRRP